MTDLVLSLIPIETAPANIAFLFIKVGDTPLCCFGTCTSAGLTYYPKMLFESLA
jgi:hypothetical protein